MKGAAAQGSDLLVSNVMCANPQIPGAWKNYSVNWLGINETQGI
jgi:hypothetical protein